VRVVLDYRPALRGPSGVGEYVHQLAHALLHASARPREEMRTVALFSSSWKDRLQLSHSLAGAVAIDRRIPVSVLNAAWHRLEWPSIEMLSGQRFDVAHSLHPLLMPARTAAQVVTIHDLNFLAHPERTRAEIRRDYPRLAREHAHRADHIVVPSRFTAGAVEQQLEVPAARISVCSPGAPAWAPLPAPPHEGYVLFIGTLEPRKNLGMLLDAYQRLAAAAGRSAVPELVLAGRATAEAGPWLERLARPPLAGLVRAIGYVDPADRERVYRGARMLVQPSFEEGFGIPVLEAMTLGIPVVAADRGALPEVLGDAGLLVDPGSADQMAGAIQRLSSDPQLAASCHERGRARAAAFRWTSTAERVLDAYACAMERRRARGGGSR
jgi:glycosyltransferase involved in cell wall biosynthesis